MKGKAALRFQGTASRGPPAQGLGPGSPHQAWTLSSEGDPSRLQQPSGHQSDPARVQLGGMARCGVTEACPPHPPP